MTKGETSELWYKDGLKFTCSGCGDCCTGAPGFVWVDQSEMQAIADSLSMPLEDFEDQYTRKIGARRSLKEFSNGDCVFFDIRTLHGSLSQSIPKSTIHRYTLRMAKEGSIIQYRGDWAQAERAIMETNGYRNGDDLSGKMFPTLYQRIL